MAARGQPQHRGERRLGQPRDLADGLDPATVQLAGRRRPDAPEPLDRQRVKELQLLAGRHHEQPVRLGHAARDLGQELRAGHADRDREPDLVVDPAPQPCRDLLRRSRDVVEPPHVQERLVDGQPLDERGRVLEDREHRLARLDIGGHPRLDDDRVRAEPEGPSPAHRGADPQRLRLVARRQHDPAADDHGAPA